MTETRFFETEKPSKNDIKWLANYNALKQYINENRHLPDKKKEENRGLLNWWKYNKRCAKQGKLDKERVEMLQALSDMRETHITQLT